MEVRVRPGPVVRGPGWTPSQGGFQYPVHQETGTAAVESNRSRLSQAVGLMEVYVFLISLSLSSSLSLSLSPFPSRSPSLYLSLLPVMWESIGRG